MNTAIDIQKLSLEISGRNPILNNINLQIEQGSFLLILGENGAGKTSLLDLMMGFRKPSQGQILVHGKIPSQDPWQDRREIAYLSEKVDLPGDWSVQEFLSFNSRFYESYSLSIEAKLAKEFKIQLKARIGNMSAGEIRRVQIVAALSAQPKLILIDEITAVLDIIGRHRFLRMLGELNTQNGGTILLATNIVENLDLYASHVALMDRGSLISIEKIQDFKNSSPASSFSDCVAQRLEVL